jgi:exopolysaccharide biosynthesis predicted pyruvyltransferase EpsI
MRLLVRILIRNLLKIKHVSIYFFNSLYNNYKNNTHNHVLCAWICNKNLLQKKYIKIIWHWDSNLGLLNDCQRHWALHHWMDDLQNAIIIVGDILYLFIQFSISITKPAITAPSMFVYISQVVYYNHWLQQYDWHKTEKHQTKVECVPSYRVTEYARSAIRA